MGVRRVAIEIDGTVQGVGFRPFVVTLARHLGLAGDVANVGGMVVIDAQGPPGAVADLLRRLATEAPAAASVTAVRVREEIPRDAVGFVVRARSYGAAVITVHRGPHALHEPNG